MDVRPVRILSRPKGIRPRDAPFPKGVGGQNVVAILTGSNYKGASRVWPDAGRELARRVIVDTGSCVSLAGLVRICISRRNRIRIHADAVYLITDKSLN